MSRLRRFFAALLTSVALWFKPELKAQPDEQLVLSDLADALAMVESGNNPRAIGSHGERGRCQFMDYAWTETTSASFRLWASSDCELTRDVERRRLAYLCRHLIARGIAPDPAFVAAAWRFGAYNATRFVRSEYAQRVANLYWEARQKAGRAAP